MLGNSGGNGKPNGLLPAKTRCPANEHSSGVRRRHARLPQRRITIIWVRVRIMLIFMILAMLASGWALVQVVLDVVPMLNRCRPLTPGQCRCCHSASLVRIANPHDRTGYNIMIVCCAAWEQDLAMMLEDWASSGSGIGDIKMNYLLGVLIPWIIRHIAGKEEVWQKIPRLPPFVTWVT